MRRLMLLRHAKTENEAPSGRDRDRRLDDRGRHDAAEIGGWIGRHPPFPGLALVSPAIRAHQTWEIAWKAMKDLVPEPQVELIPDLYGADPSQLLQTIREASDAAGRRALADNLPTSGLAVFDFAVDDWADVAFRRGRLALFVTPKLLKQTSGDYRDQAGPPQAATHARLQA